MDICNSSNKPFFNIKKGDLLVGVNYCIIAGNPAIRFIFRRKNNKKLLHQNFISSDMKTRDRWLRDVGYLNPFDLIGFFVEEVYINSPGVIIRFSNQNKLFLDLQDQLLERIHHEDSVE